jgi:ribosomal protein S18 acetylase RimI-like enzyme
MFPIQQTGAFVETATPLRATAAGLVHLWSSTLPMPFQRRTNIHAKRGTLAATKATTTTTDESSDKSVLLLQHPTNKTSSSSSFFIRPALMIDMGPASKILSDGFFKSNTNFFTYQWERLQTYLSLESAFPTRKSKHEMFVACCAKRGTVWGIVEIDARVATTNKLTSTGEMVNTTTTTNSSTKSRTGSDDNEGAPLGQDGPYICNLAVDEKYKRQGIATALVQECERQVQEWYNQDKAEEQAKLLQEANKTYSDNDINIINNKNATASSTTIPLIISNSLCLKVRESNKAAIQLYTKLGYQSIWQETEDKTEETLLLMRKQLCQRDVRRRSKAINYSRQARYSVNRRTEAT